MSPVSMPAARRAARRVTHVRGARGGRFDRADADSDAEHPAGDDVGDGEPGTTEVWRRPRQRALEHDGRVRAARGRLRRCVRVRVAQAATLESRSFELGHREDRPVLRDRALMRGEGRQEPGIRVELSEGLRNSARGRHESVVTRRASVPARQQKLAVSCLVIRRAGALVLTPPKNGSAPNQRNFNAAGYLSFTARVLGLVAPVERTWIVAVPEV